MKILLTIDDNYELISFISPNSTQTQFIFCRKQFGYEYLYKNGTFGFLPNDNAYFSTLDEIVNAFIAYITQ